MNLKWTREHAGRYTATRGDNQFLINEYVAGDWELTVNGQHQGYSGTKRGCQERAQRFLKGEQW